MYNIHEKLVTFYENHNFQNYRDKVMLLFTSTHAKYKMQKRIEAIQKVSYLQRCRFAVHDILVRAHGGNETIHFTKTIVCTNFSILFNKNDYTLFVKRLHLFLTAERNISNILPSMRYKAASYAEKTSLYQRIRLP